MPAPDTVRADGMDWPLQTFIDSYRMIVTGGSAPDFGSLDPLVDVLMENGSYVKAQRASLVEWHRAHAFACDAMPHGHKCEMCGDDTAPDELLSNHGWCDGCTYSAEIEEA